MFNVVGNLSKQMSSAVILFYCWGSVDSDRWLLGSEKKKDGEPDQDINCSGWYGTRIKGHFPALIWVLFCFAWFHAVSSCQ